MCGRYTYYSSEEILNQFELSYKDEDQTKIALNLPDNFNVSPSSEILVHLDNVA